MTSRFFGQARGEQNTCIILQCGRHVGQVSMCPTISGPSKMLVARRTCLRRVRRIRVHANCWWRVGCDGDTSDDFGCAQKCWQRFRRFRVRAKSWWRVVRVRGASDNFMSARNVGCASHVLAARPTISGPRGMSVACCTCRRRVQRFQVRA